MCIRDRYGIDEGPVELEQLTSSAPRDDDACHRSTRRAVGIELDAKIRERDDLPPRELCKTGFDSRECLRVGQDFRRLLKGVVLVDWNERSGRLSVAGHQHVIATIGDVAQQGAEIGPELTDWHSLRH